MVASVSFPYLEHRAKHTQGDLENALGNPRHAHAVRQYLDSLELLTEAAEQMRATATPDGKQAIDALLLETVGKIEQRINAMGKSFSPRDFFTGATTLTRPRTQLIEQVRSGIQEIRDHVSYAEQREQELALAKDLALMQERLNAPGRERSSAIDRLAASRKPGGHELN